MGSTDLPRPLTSKQLQKLLDNMLDTKLKAILADKKRTAMNQDSRGLSNDISKLERELQGVKASSKTKLTSQSVPDNKIENDEDEDDEVEEHTEENEKVAEPIHRPQYECNACSTWFEDGEQNIGITYWSFPGDPSRHDDGNTLYVKKNSTVREVVGWECEDGHPNFDATAPTIHDFWLCPECQEEHNNKKQAINCCK